MSTAKETYAELFKEASASDEVRLIKEALSPMQGLALLGTGLGAGGIGLAVGKKLERQKAEEEIARRKALTFGAGALAGLVAPTALKHLKGAVGMGLNPDGAYYDEFTEF